MKETGIYIRMAGCLLLAIGICNSTEAGPRSNSERVNQSILTVEMPYDFFVALASYQELSEAEKAGTDVHRNLLPVLQIIIDYLRLERRKLIQRHATGQTAVHLKSVLNRLDRQIEGFSKELTYRRKVLEYETLLETQQKLYENQ